MTELPLDDVNVLDFSQAAAGPYGATLLASNGADVVMVEPQGGGSQRHYVGGAFFPNVGRSKRSLVLDLKSDSSDSVIEELVKKTDVLIHNYRPDTVERLGLEYDRLRAYNDELIYCSLTGYGEEGKYADRPAYDPHAQAMSGLMSNTGEPDRKPSRIGASPMDWGSGIFLAYAVMVALWNRERTAEGQKVEISLFDTAAAYMGYWYTYYSKYGETPERKGHAYAPYAPYGVVETGDGQIYVAAPLQRQWENLCEEFDRGDWVTDPRFETPEDRREHREEVFEALETEFESFSASEVVDRLIDAQVPAAEVQTIAEAAMDDHLRQRGTTMTIEDHQGDEVIAARNPIKFSRHAEREDPFLADIGEHTQEVLHQHGFTEEMIEHLQSKDVIE
jgi:crotonobetainyl-CoA:carnitine CoA-transferase CaiB-like acyl-CoA transferase